MKKTDAGPWHVQEDDPIEGPWHAMFGGEYMAECSYPEAAALIVEAVNSHAANKSRIKALEAELTALKRKQQ